MFKRKGTNSDEINILIKNVLLANETKYIYACQCRRFTSMFPNIFSIKDHWRSMKYAFRFVQYTCICSKYMLPTSPWTKMITHLLDTRCLLHSGQITSHIYTGCLLHLKQTTKMTHLLDTFYFSCITKSSQYNYMDNWNLVLKCMNVTH